MQMYGTLYNLLWYFILLFSTLLFSYNTEQTRHVKVSEVWDESNSQLSFDKMMSVAATFLKDSDRDLFITKAKATYVDEDGEVITMSSNSELKDAFFQVLKTYPSQKKAFVVLVATPQKEKKPAKIASSAKASMPKRIQVRKVQPNKKLFAVSSDKATPAGCTLKTEDVAFIHARHTCDGCNKTPIVGDRYRAKNIADFDLCGACMNKYEGDKADFEIQFSDRDRCMQDKWRMMKSRCTPDSFNSIACAWNSRVNGDLATFLKDIQEKTGAVIESATVYGDAAAASNIEKSEVAPSADRKAKESDEKEKKPSPADSFLDDADGSIAEQIGRTLDVCVAAIEDVMDVQVEKVNTNVSSLKSPGLSPAAADAVSVASSMVSSMNDTTKKMDGSSQTEDVPKEKDEVKVPQVEDASSDGEEGWSVVDNDYDDDNEKQSPTLSPIVLAKWDKELHGLHQLGFLDDKKNIDALEHLEAAALGCDSIDEITVAQAVEYLLK